VLKPKPLTKSFVFLWVLYFGVGLLGTQIVWASRGFWRKRDSLVRFEYAEKNRDLLRRIERALQEHVTEKDLDSNKLAALVPASPRRIEKVLKKGRGETFQTLLMRSRVEIAKERLRSSRSSEAFVANSCGFKNVDEMEKCFARFCRTTPFKYRREFHVT
jgi:transcriptional regulator GlxA family with amidase domain